jgi:hypothetical protein
MQTMTSERGRAVTRALLFICSVATVICALASLVGAPIGLSFVIPYGLMYLLLYVLRLQERIEGKQKPPAERVDQGRRAAWPSS